MSTDLMTESMCDMARRTFLRRSAVMLGGVLLAGPTAARARDCRVTASDIVGPFYRFGAPFQTRLAGPAEPGPRLMLTGTVFSANCQSPLPGALIEVWQANHAGVYDTNTPGNFTEATTFHLQGMLSTNAKGQ
jgi:catechol 1,2-dioxygenase